MSLRVAIVHDYLTQRGGAERVALAMLRCFPNATLYTTIYNPETTYAEFAEYAKVFPGSVQFDQAFTTAWFDTAQLATPMLRDARAMRGFLASAPGIVVIPQRSEHAASARVRAHLEARRPAWPDLAATAAALHVSTSTLQRRLAADGLSFQTVKDQLRLDLAIVRLNTSAVALTTLALELGFADSAAFQRAFQLFLLHYYAAAAATQRKRRADNDR